MPNKRWRMIMRLELQATVPSELNGKPCRRVLIFWDHELEEMKKKYGDALHIIC